MKDRENEARMAALWLIHGDACVKLLQAHGRAGHAENFAAALGQVAEIVADEVGRDTLSAAMDWASNHLWGGSAVDPQSPPRRKYLH